MTLKGHFEPQSKGALNASYASRRRVLRVSRKTDHRSGGKESASSDYIVARFVEAGGLMSYGEDRLEMFRRAAEIVDKILKGTKPADIPVDRPKKFDFVINLKAANQIGLTIPPNVLARADRVIRVKAE